MKKIYVHAGDVQQARDCCRLRFGELVYVSSMQELRGVDGTGKRLLIYGSALEKQNSRAIISLAVQRGFQLKHVGGPR